MWLEEFKKVGVKGRWPEYFESLMHNVKSEDKAIVMSMGMTGSNGKTNEHRKIKKKQVMKVIRNLQKGKQQEGMEFWLKCLNMQEKLYLNECMRYICELACEDWRVLTDVKLEVWVSFLQGIPHHVGLL